MPLPATEELFRRYFQDPEDRAYEAESAAEMSSRLRERSQAATGRARAQAEHEAQISVLEQRYNSLTAEFVASQRQRVADAQYTAFRGLSELLETKIRSMASDEAGRERYKNMLRESMNACVPLIPPPVLVSCRHEDEAIVRSLLQEMQDGRGGETAGTNGVVVSLADSWLPATELGLRIYAADGSVSFDERVKTRIARAMECYQTDITRRLFPAQ